MEGLVVAAMLVGAVILAVRGLPWIRANKPMNILWVVVAEIVLGVTLEVLILRR